MNLAAFYILLIVTAICIGFLFGWRGARDMPETPKDFAVSAAWVLAWSAAWIFLCVVVLIASINSFGMARLFQTGLWFTTVSGLLWVPVAMITYVIRALRLRRA